MNADTDRTMVQTATKGVKSLKAFLAKVNNDWVLSLASGLAFNLLVATIPIIVAVISLAGFIYGGLDPMVKEELIAIIQKAFPPPIPSEEIVSQALDSLNKNAGLLGLIAIIVAIFAGSGLFVTMEGYFDIIYQIRPRGLIQQYIMAIGMILLFVFMTPLVIFADSIPALVDSILRATPISQLSTNSFIIHIAGILTGLLVSWGLLEIIYIVVPNRLIRFRNSWLGAFLAAVALQLYLLLFPFYVTHFLSGYTGAIGFAVILIFFFYYFAVILLVGVEINAFFAEGIHGLPDNLAGMVHDFTHRQSTTGYDQ